MSKCSPLGQVAFWLLVIGGLNWGLMGVNMEWNVVEMLLGTWEWLVRLVYVLVGLSALYLLFGCLSGKCE